MTVHIREVGGSSPLAPTRDHTDSSALSTVHGAEGSTLHATALAGVPRSKERSPKPSLAGSLRSVQDRRIPSSPPSKGSKEEPFRPPTTLGEP
jgi:hypothetical protein